MNLPQPLQRCSCMAWALTLSQKGAVTGSATGSGFCAVLVPVISSGPPEDGGAGRGEDPAGAVDDRQLRVLDLPLALVDVVVAQLAHRLDDREDAVHAGVVVGEAPAVGVHREGAARRGALPADERAPLALLA